MRRCRRQNAAEAPRRIGARHQQALDRQAHEWLDHIDGLQAIAARRQHQHWLDAFDPGKSG